MYIKYTFIIVYICLLDYYCKNCILHYIYYTNSTINKKNFNYVDLIFMIF